MACWQYASVQMTKPVMDATAEQAAGTVLIVDDSRIHLSNLRAILSKAGYKTLMAHSGIEALGTVREQLPDVVLLDVLMPDLTGYETCERMRAIAGAEQIPVLFMTGLHDADSKLKGFAAGAVDYITKPFEEGELLARVRTHLNITRLRQRLDAEIRDKDRALVELDAFSHTVAHDLKNPLAGIVGMAECLLDAVPRGDTAALSEMAASLRDSGQTCMHIVEEILLLASIGNDGEVELETVDLGESLQQALQQLNWRIRETGAQIEIADNIALNVTARAGWVMQVWMNYLSNALNHGGQPPQMRLGAALDGAFARFWVDDNGPGIPAERRDALFVAFSRLGVRKVNGTGLGLSIVARIAKRLGGSVGIEDSALGGTRFWCKLPSARKAL